MNLKRIIAIFVVVSSILLVTGIFIVKTVERANIDQNEIESKGDDSEEVTEKRYKKIVYATIVCTPNDKALDNNTISNDIGISKEKIKNYEKLINSDTIKSNIEKDYINIGDVQLEAIEDTDLIRVMYICDEHSDDECLGILKKYIEIFTKKIDEIYGQKILVVDDPQIMIKTK